MRRPALARQPFLEGLDARAEHELRPSRHLGEGRQHLLRDLSLLRREIDQRDAHHHLRCSSTGSEVRTRSW